MKMKPIYVFCLLSAAYCVTAVVAGDHPMISHEQLVEMVFHIQKENVQVHRQMTEVQRENAEIRGEMAEVRRENAEVRKENANLRNENEAIKYKLVELGRVVTDIESDNSELLKDMTNLKHSMADINTDREGEYTMFSVAADRSESYDEDDTIIFHHVYSDVKPSGSDGGWDPNSHRYVCPTSGQYLFMATIFKYDAPANNRFPISLMMESERLTVINNFKSSFIEEVLVWSSTAHVIVPCSAGEEVYLAAAIAGSLYDDGDRYNQFSGVLLKPGL